MKVLDFVKSGGLDLTKSRTEADSDIAPSLGMGTVYVSVASSSHHLDALHEVADERLALGDRPVLQEVSEVPQRTVLSPPCQADLLSSAQAGSRHPLSQPPAAPHGGLRDMMRGDRTSSVSSLVSMAS